MQILKICIGTAFNWRRKWEDHAYSSTMELRWVTASFRTHTLYSNGPGRKATWATAFLCGAYARKCLYSKEENTCLDPGEKQAAWKSCL